MSKTKSGILIKNLELNLSPKTAQIKQLRQHSLLDKYTRLATVTIWHNKKTYYIFKKINKKKLPISREKFTSLGKILSDFISPSLILIVKLKI